MWLPFASPAVGIAYGGYVPSFLERHPGSVDFVEIPFELLRHDPTVSAIRDLTRVVLHCASMSIAGTALCPPQTIKHIQDCVRDTETPWIGEHLAFVTADRHAAGERADPYAPGEPYNIGYTVSPPMNEATVARVTDHLRCYARHFEVPLLIENSPLYFRMPSTAMTQAEFISRVLEESNVYLLLDLAHFLISAETMGFDPFDEVEKLPLERVMEMHISGMDTQPDGTWDSHAQRAPEAVYQLLDQVLVRARPSAVTLEYNWSVRFPEADLRQEIDRLRYLLKRRTAVV